MKTIGLEPTAASRETGHARAEWIPWKLWLKTGPAHIAMRLAYASALQSHLLGSQISPL